MQMTRPPYIVFYDGQCRICRRGRQTLERLRPRAQVRFIDANDPRAMAPYPDMAGADVAGQMYVRDPAGKISGGYDALVALVPTLSGISWAAGILGSRALRAIGRPAYRWLAANRYRLGGQRACHDDRACSLRPCANRA
jgi:predicted DCC family thiol-disulfide oxidoreductase YuxK